MMKRYTIEEVEAMPTIHQGQYSDLKIDTGTERLWLSRMTAADGEEFAIQVEQLIENGACWVESDAYHGTEDGIR